MQSKNKDARLKTVDLDTDAIIVAYGSNLPASFPSEQLSASQAFAAVVKALQDKGLKVTKISRLWRSKAWPDPNDPPYVNAVLVVDTHLQAVELMKSLHDIEREAGRVRDGRPNQPRVLDLDLIAYGREVRDGSDGLILPHPRATERAFVMGPIRDVLPQWKHPVLNETSESLYEKSTVGTDAYPLGADTD
jgi:2-amino-4-hydroxy-6-hydroxymethyldihydropteridine diphosphokinase